MSRHESLMWLADKANWQFSVETQMWALRPIPAERFDGMREAVCQAAFEASIDNLISAVEGKKDSP